MRLFLALTFLLLASTVSAQDRTHLSSVTVGDKTYHVDTWISEDGRRSSTTVREVDVPDLGRLVHEIAEGTGLLNAQRKWEAKQSAKRQQKKGLTPLAGDARAAYLTSVCATGTFSFCPKPAPAPEH